MTGRKNETTCADDTLETKLRERGYRVRVLWEVKGPKNTQIAWMTAYAIAQSVCIMQTYRDGGWEVYTPGASLDIDATVQDVIDRCTRPSA